MYVNVHYGKEVWLEWCLSSCDLCLLACLLCFALPFVVVSHLLFSEIVFDVLLRLLNKEVSDHSRHLQQYFQVFLAYAHKGPLEVSIYVV